MSTMTSNSPQVKNHHCLQEGAEKAEAIMLRPLRNDSLNTIYNAAEINIERRKIKV